jgi:hypothetical protein
MDMDLFRETSGITGFWECGLHLLMLDERCDKVARKYVLFQRYSWRKMRTRIHRSINILCDDVLENFRKATPCFIAGV